MPLRRRLGGAALAVLGLPLLTYGLLHIGEHVELSTALLSYLALTMAVAAVGGFWPSLPAAVAGFVAANWFFTSPFRTWTIDRGQDLLALAVFLAVALVVSALVHLVGRRATEAARARAEAAALTRLAVSVADSARPLDRLVDDLVETFGLECAAVLAREDERWRVEAYAGRPGLHSPEDARDVIPLKDDRVLALRGPHAPDDEQRILAAYVAQLALAVRRQSLEADAARAQVLDDGNRLRTALLSAVSHDLRTPLATIKAWLTGLLEGDVTFSPEEVHDILAAAVGETDRLNALVGNLLDMSRLQAGAVQVHRQPTDLDAVTAAAVSTLPHSAGRLRIDIPDTLPAVETDAALLERVVANLVDNALRHTPGDTPVVVRADCAANGTLHLRISDCGPGIGADAKEQIFEPFQRLGDRADTGGVGLGLAVARGLTDAIRVGLQVEDTPGGGTTMLLSFPP